MSSQVPDRTPQTVDELRGDYVEMARSHSTVAQAAAGATIEYPFYLDGRSVYTAASTGAKGDSGSVLRRVQWVPSAAITFNASNYFTLNVNRRNAATGALIGAHGSVGQLVLNAASLTAYAAVDVPGFVAGTYLNAAELLTYELIQTASGLAVPIGLLVLEFARLGV